jgi:hypothetical protein
MKSTAARASAGAESGPAEDSGAAAAGTVGGTAYSAPVLLRPPAPTLRIARQGVSTRRAVGDAAAKPVEGRGMCRRRLACCGVRRMSTGPGGPLLEYSRLAQGGTIHEDRYQLQAVHQLQRLYSAVVGDTALNRCVCGGGARPAHLRTPGRTHCGDRRSCTPVAAAVRG